MSVARNLAVRTQAGKVSGGTFTTWHTPGTPTIVTQL
jgi:hypothetical protein